MYIPLSFVPTHGYILQFLLIDLRAALDAVGIILDQISVTSTDETTGALLLAAVVHPRSELQDASVEEITAIAQAAVNQ